MTSRFQSFNGPVWFLQLWSGAYFPEIRPNPIDDPGFPLIGFSLAPAYIPHRDLPHQSFPSFRILVLPHPCSSIGAKHLALDKPSENESSLRLLSVTGFSGKHYWAVLSKTASALEAKHAIRPPFIRLWFYFRDYINKAIVIILFIIQYSISS